MKNWLKSSQDPEKISSTVRGVVTGFASVIMFFGLQVFGVEITQADITQIGSYLGMIGGGIWGIYGLAMKMVMKMGKV